MSEIPQIRPNRVVVEVDESEEGSVLIPKINLGSKKMRNLKSLFKFSLKKDWLKSKKVKVILGIVAVLLVINIIVGILFFRVYRKAMVIKASIDNLQSAYQSQDFENEETINIPFIENVAKNLWNEAKHDFRRILTKNFSRNTW